MKPKFAQSNLVQISWRQTSCFNICSPIDDWDARCCYWGCSRTWKLV